MKPHPLDARFEELETRWWAHQDRLLAANPHPSEPRQAWPMRDLLEWRQDARALLQDAFSQPHPALQRWVELEAEPAGVSQSLVMDAMLVAVLAARRALHAVVAELPPPAPQAAWQDASATPAGAFVPPETTVPSQPVMPVAAAMDLPPATPAVFDVPSTPLEPAPWPQTPATPAASWDATAAAAQATLEPAPAAPAVLAGSLPEVPPGADIGFLDLGLEDVGLAPPAVAVAPLEVPPLGDVPTAAPVAAQEPAPPAASFDDAELDVGMEEDAAPAQAAPAAPATPAAPVAEAPVEDAMDAVMEDMALDAAPAAMAPAVEAEISADDVEMDDATPAEAAAPDAVGDDAVMEVADEQLHEPPLPPVPRIDVPIIRFASIKPLKVEAPAVDVEDVDLGMTDPPHAAPVEAAAPAGEDVFMGDSIVMARPSLPEEPLPAEDVFLGDSVVMARPVLREEPPAAEDVFLGDSVVMPAPQPVASAEPTLAAAASDEVDMDMDLDAPPVPAPFHVDVVATPVPVAEPVPAAPAQMEAMDLGLEFIEPMPAAPPAEPALAPPEPAPVEEDDGLDPDQLAARLALAMEDGSLSEDSFPNMDASQTAGAPTPFPDVLTPVPGQEMAAPAPMEMAAPVPVPSTPFPDVLTPVPGQEMAAPAPMEMAAPAPVPSTPFPDVLTPVPGQEMAAAPPMVAAPAPLAVPDAAPQAAPEPQPMDTPGTLVGEAAATSAVEPSYSPASGITLAIDGAAQMQAVWKDILSSGGGMFVGTPTPAAMNSRIPLHLVTPGGSLQAFGVVVHVVDAAMAAATGMPAGMGLQLSPLEDAQREQILAYMNGSRTSLGVEAAPAATSENLADLLGAARVFMLHLERDDLFGAAELPVNAEVSAIQDRIYELVDRFSQQPPGATPPQLARLATAARGVGRLNTLLDPVQRAAYEARAPSAPEQPMVAGGAHTASSEPAPPSKEEVAAAAAKALADAVLQAQKLAVTGRMSMDKQHFEDAEQQYAGAVALAPDVPAYKVEHAWALAMNPKRPEADRRKEALALLKAVTSKTKVAEAYFKSALIQRLMGEDPAALVSARHAVSLDPRHTEATSLVRFLEMRLDKDGKSKPGIMNKLTGR